MLLAMSLSRGVHSAAEHGRRRLMLQNSAKSRFLALFQRSRQLCSTSSVWRAAKPTISPSASAPPSLPRRLLTVLPGLALSYAVMEAGHTMSTVTPLPMVPSSIVLGLVTGSLLRSLTSLSSVFSPGVKLASTAVLRIGVVCVGLKLSLPDIAIVSSSVLPVVGVCIASGIALVLALGRCLGVSRNLTLLTAAGTSICGVTAISALAPAIRATQKEVALAVANVVAFGTFGMLTYPTVINRILDSSEEIGIFLGVAIHDTSQVMGAALAYADMYSDDIVLEVAAITKMTRNLCLAAVIPGLAYLGGIAPKSGSAPLVPGFVIGFVAMAILRSIGDSMVISEGAAFRLLDADLWTTLTSSIGTTASVYLLATAMAGIGLSTDIASLRGVGLRPFILGLAGAATVGTIGVAAAVLAGPFLHEHLARDNTADQ